MEKRIKKSAFTLIELLVVIAIISLLVSILLPSLNKARELARTVVCSSMLKSFGLTMQMYTNDSDGYLPAYRDPTSPTGAWYLGFAPYMGGTEDNTAKNLLADNSNGCDWVCPSAPENIGFTLGVHYNMFNQGPFVYLAPNLGYADKCTELTEISTKCFLMTDASNDGVYSPSYWSLGSDQSGNDIPDSSPALLSYFDYNGAAPDRHDGKANYVFSDAHVETKSLNEWEDNSDLWTP